MRGGESVDADEGWRMCRQVGGAEPEQAGLGGSPSRAGWTEDGVGTAKKASRGLDVECGQCHTKASEREDVAERSEGPWWDSDTKTCISFLLLFVCPKKNCNWNCLIFKRVVRDGMASWGLCSPEGGGRR